MKSFFWPVAGSRFVVAVFFLLALWGSHGEAVAAAPVTTIEAMPANPSVGSTASFSFRADVPASFRCRLDGVQWSECSSPVTYHQLSFGSHTFSVSARDATGNDEAVPATFSWSVLATGAAAILSPANGTVLADESQIFTWSDAGAAYYQLWLGSAPGDYSFGAYPLTSSTSLTANVLPRDGRTVFARLWSKKGGEWLYSDYNFKAATGTRGWRFGGGDAAGTGTAPLAAAPSSGTFFPYASFAAGDSGVQLRTGDLDGDGRDDIVAASGNRLFILYGDPVKSRVDLVLPAQVSSLILEDLDRDGRLEIVTGSLDTDPLILTVHKGDGTLMKTLQGRSGSAGGGVYPLKCQEGSVLLVQYDSEDPKAARGVAAIDTASGDHGSELWYHGLGLRSTAASIGTEPDGRLLILPWTRPSGQLEGGSPLRYLVSADGRTAEPAPEPVAAPPGTEVRRIAFDVDGLGAKEIVTLSGPSTDRPDASRITVSELDGTQMYGYDIAGKSFPRLAVTRTDGGIAKSILYSVAGKLEILDQHLVPVGAVPLSEGAYLAGVADLDGDGIAEVLVAEGRLLKALHATTLEEQWSVLLQKDIAGPVIPVQLTGDASAVLASSLADGTLVLLAGGADEPADLISPPDSTVLSGSQLFTWNHARNGRYQLWIGTQPGIYDIGAYPETSTAETQVEVTDLPTDGRILFARLWTYAGGIWRHSDYSFITALVPAALVFPAVSSILSAGEQTFRWNHSGADYYQLWVGSYPGSYDLGHTQLTKSTSSTLQGIPVDGRTVYVRLWSLIGAQWIYHDQEFQASGSPTPAVIASPPDQSTLSGGSQQFTWNDSGAALYQLWIGSEPGSYNLGVYPSMSGTTATSLTVDDLPTDGRKLYARLWYLAGSTWRHTDYTYTADGSMAELGGTLAECSLNKNLWLIDIGSPIPGQPWLTQLEDPEYGTSFRFLFNASSFPDSPNQQADVAFGGGNPLSKGRWDFSSVGKISFLFKDLNPEDVDQTGDSILSHYVLVYDKHFRYRQWFLDNAKDPAAHRFRPGEWTRVEVSISDDPSSYFREQGVTDDPMDFSEIVYFEVGVFGRNIKPGAPYAFEVAGVGTDNPAPTIDAPPDAAQ